MIILVVVAALFATVIAFILGEKNGDAAGYDRGVFDGRQQARNEAAISAADVARRQREATERERAAQLPPKVIDDLPAVVTPMQKGNPQKRRK